MSVTFLDIFHMSRLYQCNMVGVKSGTGSGFGSQNEVKVLSDGESSTYCSSVKLPALANFPWCDSISSPAAVSVVVCAQLQKDLNNFVVQELVSMALG